MPRVIVTEPVHEDALALLRDAGWDVQGPGAPLARVEALLVRVAPVGADQVGLFDVISKHGVGVDNIALDAARAAGTVVMNTPGANAAAVAEQTLMLMLALARDLPGQMAGHRQGVQGLEGRRLLIIGRGETGERVGQLAYAFHMHTIWHLRHSGREALHAALAQTDIVTLHCPLTDHTRGLIGAQELALLPKGAMLINVARGGLVDEGALDAALRAGHLGGAALDVTEVEPLPADHPLRSAPNLILTPHGAGLGQGAFRRMGMEAAQNILDHAAGRARPSHTVVAATGARRTGP